MTRKSGLSARWRLLRIDAGEALRWSLLAITVLIGPAASLMIAMAIPAPGRAA